MERFEYQDIEIAKNKPSDLDPGYVEEMEKPRRGMLLATKGHPIKRWGCSWPRSGGSTQRLSKRLRRSLEVR